MVWVVCSGVCVRCRTRSALCVRSLICVVGWCVKCVWFVCGVILCVVCGVNGVLHIMCAVSDLCGGLVCEVCMVCGLCVVL